MILCSTAQRICELTHRLHLHYMSLFFGICYLLFAFKANYICEDNIYRVGQIKRGQLTFLLVISEDIYKII